MRDVVRAVVFSNYVEGSEMVLFLSGELTLLSCEHSQSLHESSSFTAVGAVLREERPLHFEGHKISGGLLSSLHLKNEVLVSA